MTKSGEALSHPHGALRLDVRRGLDGLERGALGPGQLKVHRGPDGDRVRPRDVSGPQEDPPADEGGGKKAVRALPLDHAPGVAAPHLRARETAGVGAVAVLQTDNSQGRLKWAKSVPCINKY